MLVRGALVVAAMIAGAPVLLPDVACADPPRLRLALEAGSEVDSNVHRTAVQEGADDASVTAAGGRVAARATLGWRAKQGHAFRLHVIAAAKAFAVGEDASSADVGVVTADTRWDSRLGDRPVVASMRGSYYEAIERPGGANRDFRTGDGALALTLLGADDHRLTASLGYRLFHYKPNPGLDFAGETVGLAWRHTTELGRADGPDDLRPTLDIGLAYVMQRRRYETAAFVNNCGDAPLSSVCLDRTDAYRVDLFHGGAAEITYTSERIFGARYELQLNDSNSFGQSLVRHRVEFGVTTETWADVFLTAKLIVQLNEALDPILLSGDVGTFLTIEDESRNALILHFTREVTPAWSVEARASFYTNAFADSELDYRRTTVYAGAVWALPDAP